MSEVGLLDVWMHPVLHPLWRAFKRYESLQFRAPGCGKHCNVNGWTIRVRTTRIGHEITRCSFWLAHPIDKAQNVQHIEHDRMPTAHDLAMQRGRNPSSTSACDTRRASEARIATPTS